MRSLFLDTHLILLLQSLYKEVFIRYGYSKSDLELVEDITLFICKENCLFYQKIGKKHCPPPI